LPSAPPSITSRYIRCANGTDDRDGPAGKPGAWADGYGGGPLVSFPGLGRSSTTMTILISDSGGALSRNPWGSHRQTQAERGTVSLLCRGVRTHSSQPPPKPFGLFSSWQTGMGRACTRTGRPGRPWPVFSNDNRAGVGQNYTGAGEHSTMQGLRQTARLMECRRLTRAVPSAEHRAGARPMGTTMRPLPWSWVPLPYPWSNVGDSSYSTLVQGIQRAAQGLTERSFGGRRGFCRGQPQSKACPTSLYPSPSANQLYYSQPWGHGPIA